MDDPLRAFLSDSEHKPASPPWIRLFRLSQSQPVPLAWKYQGDVCGECGATVTMATKRHLPQSIRSFWLCLNCGNTSSQDTGQPAVTGTDWSPPALAVKQLRRAAFRAQPVFRIGRPKRGEGD
jgi:hypothetical protein